MLLSRSRHPLARPSRRGRDRHRRRVRMFLTVSFNFLATGHRPCNSGRTKPGRAQPPGARPGTNEICRTLLLRDPRPARLVGGGRAGRGDGGEGLIARKYDKADGKRFVETLENLYET